MESPYLEYLNRHKDDYLPAVRVPSSLRQKLFEEFVESDIRSFGAFLVRKILTSENSTQ